MPHLVDGTYNTKSIRGSSAAVIEVIRITDQSLEGGKSGASTSAMPGSSWTVSANRNVTMRC